MDEIDVLTAIRNRLNAVILNLNHETGETFYRPSLAGQCPLRVQWSIESGVREDRDPRRAWAALQGTASEELFGYLLEMAGAEIIHPPQQFPVESSVEPDPMTGFRPHIDRLFRWPDVGIPDWTVLELKNLRTNAHIELFLGTPVSDRQYWFQLCSYLMLAEKSIEIYAEAEPDSRWAEIRRAGIQPQQLMFFSVAKDPSTTMMMLNQRLKSTMKELNTPEKMKPEELDRSIWKQEMRERLAAVGGDIDFYISIIDRRDPYVRETWLEAVNTGREIQRAIETGGQVLPLHYIQGVPDDELPAECRWYCNWLDRHRNMEIQDQLTASIAAIRAEREESNDH